MVIKTIKSPGLRLREAHCKSISTALIGNTLKRRSINE